MKIFRLDDEQHLLVRIREGDMKAFRLVYDHYWPLLITHALRMLQDEAEAEDMVQEVLFSFYKSAHKLAPDSNISSWLFVSLRNRILNHFRNEKSKLLHLENFIQTIAHSVNSMNSPLESVVLKELQLNLEAEIERMPPRMREIFELSRMEYLSHKEIASKLKLSDKTVKTQINSALRILRGKFLKGSSSLLLCISLLLQS
jgi:RNA polymerase sigma-70 factor (ECF subfamily)